MPGQGVEIPKYEDEEEEFSDELFLPKDVDLSAGLHCVDSYLMASNVKFLVEKRALVPSFVLKNTNIVAVI